MLKPVFGMGFGPNAFSGSIRIEAQFHASTPSGTLWAPWLHRLAVGLRLAVGHAVGVRQAAKVRAICPSPRRAVRPSAPKSKSCDEVLETYIAGVISSRGGVPFEEGELTFSLQGG